MFKDKNLQEGGGGLVKATGALQPFYISSWRGHLWPTRFSQWMESASSTESGKQEQCVMIKCLTEKHKEKRPRYTIKRWLASSGQTQSSAEAFHKEPPPTTNKVPIKAKQVFGHKALWSTIPAIHPKTSA